MKIKIIASGLIFLIIGSLLAIKWLGDTSGKDPLFAQKAQASKVRKTPTARTFESSAIENEETYINREVASANTEPITKVFDANSKVILAAERVQNLNLSILEMNVLHSAYDELEKRRQALELELALSDIVDDGIVFITIPEYFEAGLELYGDFADRITSELGQSRSAEVGRALDSWVFSSNNGFGATEQNILFEREGEITKVIHTKRVLSGPFNGERGLAEITTVSRFTNNNFENYEYLTPLL